MKNYLFIGNGLNRTIDNSIAWDNILTLIEDVNKENCPNTVPLTLQFESVATTKLNSTDSYDEIKTRLTEKLAMLSLKEGCIHYDLKQLENMISGIITTNYDFLLESVFDVKEEDIKTNRKKYTVEKCAISDSNNGNLEFYHVHGLINKPKTLCLGYERYAGMLQTLRRDIKSTDDESNDEEDNIVLTSTKINNYGTLFFDSNVYFVGFGLSYAEIDIWWLIIYRAYLITTQKLERNNKIVFYCEKKDEKEQNDLREILRQLKVEVREHELPKSNNRYYDMYKTIINEIREEIEDEQINSR